MIHQIAHNVYRLIRERGGLSAEDVAAAIGAQRQVVWRWETNKQKTLPKRQQEELLVKAAGLTVQEFGEIMCEVLTPFLGRRVTMAPGEDYIPSMPLARAAKLYGLCRDHLSPENQADIEEMIAEGRRIELLAEQTCRAHAKRIERILEKAEAARDRGPSADDAE